MWLLLLILVATPGTNPRYDGAFTSRDACMAAASRANGPDPDNNRQHRTDGRIAACFKLEYPA